MSELEEFRRRKDEFFRTGDGSPLAPEQRAAFHGLVYYPPNPTLVIEARLDPDLDSAEVRMQTSTGSEQVYSRAGTVRFEVGGEPAQVTLFAPHGTEHLFLPFRDATSGNGTYPAGRYLDVEPSGEAGLITIDFNLAYNPSCAYNACWGCPIPPIENWLKVPIEAGELVYPHPIEAG